MYICWAPSGLNSLCTDKVVFSKHGAWPQGSPPPPPPPHSPYIGRAAGEHMLDVTHDCTDTNVYPCIQTAISLSTKPHTHTHRQPPENNDTHTWIKAAEQALPLQLQCRNRKYHGNRLDDSQHNTYQIWGTDTATIHLKLMCLHLCCCLLIAVSLDWQRANAFMIRPLCWPLRHWL